MSEETSESGQPIWRYEARKAPWTPPNMEDSQVEPISEHIERHVGKVSMVWHEIVSDLVHIDIHQVAPTGERPYWTLVTSGMSDLAMRTPDGNKDWAFAEVMLCLPGNWKLEQKDLKDELNYWPLRWLKVLARFPHEYNTWFSWGHSMPNGDPAAPMSPSAPFVGIVLLRPKTVSREFWTLPVRDDKKIHFFSVIPLHPGEMELKLKRGAQELDRRFEKRKVTEIIDLERPDVSKNRWWPF